MAVAQMNIVYYMELWKLPKLLDFRIIPAIKNMDHRTLSGEDSKCFPNEVSDQALTNCAPAKQGHVQ